MKRLRDIVLKYSEGYRRLFSIHEIEQSRTLQLTFGALLFFFVTTYALWIHTPYVNANNPFIVCWPYLPECESLAFLVGLPDGYSQNIFYVFLLGLIILAAYRIWRHDWVGAHVCLLFLWLWKVYAGFFISYELLGMYDYYHVLLTASILFLPFKEYFTKVFFVLLYFVSATIKFYPSWILGTYFTSLVTGLPLLPNAIVPVATTIVIASQTVGCWFLLSRHHFLQRGTFIFFEFFHFYSGFMVGFSYPLITIPILSIMFGPLYRYQRPPLTLSAAPGWIIAGLLVALQLYTFSIPGDQKITLEGFRYGAWMFDANHQCIARLTSYYPNTVNLTEESWRAPHGTRCNGFSCRTERIVYKESNQWVIEEVYESPKAWSRCSPYVLYSQYSKRCDVADRIAMQFDHAIDGGPFFRIVDENDICALSYRPFWHNAWIKEPPDAPIIGQPVKNVYSEFIE